MTNETIECTPETGPLLCGRERPSTSTQWIMNVPAPAVDQTIINIPERDCLAEVNSVQLDIRDTNVGVCEAELGENSGQRCGATDLLRQPSPVSDERLEDVDANLFDSDWSKFMLFTYIMNNNNTVFVVGNIYSNYVFVTEWGYDF